MIEFPRPFGVVHVNKPRGISSRNVVDRVLGLVRPAKVGHAGTLDPLATGVLVVCIGPATKLITYVQDHPKTYRATFRLGERSNTDDLEGEIVPVDVSEPPTEAAVRAALGAFVGRIPQVPPAYSAVRVDGRRAYELARKGRDVELEPRIVEVHAIEVVRFAYPELVLDIECGSGTYIRSIGRDLGEALGCGGLMTALERTRIGPFRIEDAADPYALSLERISPAMTCVADFPRHVCQPEELDRLVHGRPVVLETGDYPDDSPIALVGTDGILLGIADWRPAERRLKPRHVFARAN